MRTSNTILLALLAIPAFSQTAAPLQEFEAASVKVHSNTGANPPASFLRGGQLSMPNADLKSLMLLAWHLHESQLTGAPGWFESDHFHVAAKAAPDTKMDDMRTMLRNLLKERFHLEVHREDKLMPAYALVVSKRGSQLKESGPGPITCAAGRGHGGMFHYGCQHIATSEIANVVLSMGHGYLLGVPVVDQTGIQGTWEFAMDWTPAEQYNAAPSAADGQISKPVVSLFDALEAQLGLRLESKKLLLPVIVVDHVDRVPTEN